MSKLLMGFKKEVVESFKGYDKIILRELARSIGFDKSN